MPKGLPGKEALMQGSKVERAICLLARFKATGQNYVANELGCVQLFNVQRSTSTLSEIKTRRRLLSRETILAER
jgi:hypothetical protein